jgi:glycosyltransferase involved in cell wall biosynthesis
MFRSPKNEKLRIAVREVHLEQAGRAPAGLDGYEEVFIIFRLWGAVVGQAWLPVTAGTVSRTSIQDHLRQAAWPAWKQLIARGSYPAQSLPTASVVVCTRDRTDDLAQGLPRLAELATQGHEVIVVDNCPSDDRTRRLVADYPGILYVLEPCPGLDSARNRGLQAASGEVVAFTDDDAVIDPGWLPALLRNFDDPTVAIVTGITMPLELETAAQVFFERINAFQRGFVRRVIDDTTLNVLAAGVVGAGVNMAIRRSAVERIGLFDEALDGGTLSRSGGDTEYFYRALAKGYRIVYEPAALVWHRHRREWAALRRTIYGYGVGVFAWWTRALLVERELGVLKLAPRWFWQHHVRNVIRVLLRRRRRLPLDLVLAEFLGALVGPPSYLRSRWWLRRQGQAAGVMQAGEAAPRMTPRPPAAEARLQSSVGHAEGSPPMPTLSVIIPTHNRSAQLLENLSALSRQSWSVSEFEVLVVADACQDDTVERANAYAAQAPYRLRVLSHEARSRAATRNLGAAHAQSQLLLFLDDDVVAQPGLVAAHVRAQGQGPDRVVLGYSKPVLPDDPTGHSWLFGVGGRTPSWQWATRPSIHLP